LGNINEIIFTSDQLAKQHVQYAKKIHSEPGMRWGIPAIDDRIIPARGGDVSIILGRPGDGKTSLLCYLASYHARNIVEEKKNIEETVVYVTWEGTVDKIYAALLSARGRYSSTDFYWGRVSVEQAKATSVISGVMPITFIGFSSFRKTGYKAITLDSVLEAVDAIQEGDGTPKRKVRCLYLDYVQLITVPGSSNRTESTSEAIIGIKNLGIRLDIPSFIGGQAGRQVDSYQIKLAGPADAQHSSQLEQHVDGGYSIWRPSRTEQYDPNTPVDLNIYGRSVPFRPTLLLLKNWKQRGDDVGGWWPLYLRPEFLELAEMELELEGQ
jgi:replicative DNA helicase